VPNSFDCYSRANNDDAFDKIKELLNVYPAGLLATLLGIKRYAIHRREQPIPVVRLAFILWRLTFHPGQVSVFEMLTVGKYARGNPQEHQPTEDDWVI
jgi:hypothetical protein